MQAWYGPPADFAGFGDENTVEWREWHLRRASRALHTHYFATDAECRPITPITMSPSETIFTVVAGSLK